MGDNLRIFGEMDEVRALKRAFRVFWWRLGDVFALIGRLLWAWFLNTRMVRTGKIDYMLAKRGEGFACWDCHRNVPHGGMNTLSSTPGAETQAPIPPSPVPEWLQKALGH